VTVVHWARHGENVANLSRTFSYRVFDGDLTDLGVEQAERLAQTLRASRRRYGLLVCSPLRRARQTADIVSAQLGMPIGAELDDLREVNVGDLDGRNDEESWQTYDRTLAAWRNGQPSQRFPGGESGHELAARIGRGLEAVAELARSDDAVAIAHGANIRAALPMLTGQADPGADLATGGIARLTVTLRPGAAMGVKLTAWG
jgi:broad specificity phosphatase PhoE